MNECNDLQETPKISKDSSTEAVHLDIRITHQDPQIFDALLNLMSSE